MIGIYRIKNIVSGKVYIGSSINIRRRFNNHKCKLRNNNHSNKSFQSDWLEFGEVSFLFEILEICDLSELLNKETEFIKNNENCYNVLKIAYAKYGEDHSMFGKTHSKEAKEKIKIARSKQIISHSKETKSKITVSNSNRKMPVGHLEKMLKAREGLTVWNKGLKTGIVPKNKIYLDNENVIIKYNLGQSIEEIRKELKVSWDVVKRILLENKIKIRTIKEQKIINDEKRRNN